MTKGTVVYCGFKSFMILVLADDDCENSDVSSADNSARLEQQSCPRQCFLCPKRYCDADGLQAHLGSDHRPSPALICTLCQPERYFYSETKLAYHKIGKHKVPFPCPDCDEKIFTLSGIGTHKKKHDMKVCEICGKLIANNKLHTHHKDEEWCTVCGVTVCSKATLAKHLATHERVRKLCSFCGKEFKTQFRVRRHENSHKEKETFYCNVCGKKYNSKKFLEAHERSHTNEENFVCHVCGKQFASLGKLTQHARYNHFKIYKCKFCDEMFKSSGSLSRHINDQHMKLEAYNEAECKICGKKMKSR